MLSLMRLGDLWAAHRSSRGQMVFQGQKCRLGVQVEESKTMASQMVNILQERRQDGGGDAKVQYNFATPSELEAQWVALVSAGANKSQRWHARGLAPQVWAAGARGPLL